MSLFSSISLLSQSMRNFETAVNVAGNNLANQKTPGYSREVVNFTENYPLAMGKLSLGTGSSISTIERLRNLFLDQQIDTQISTKGYFDTLSTLSAELGSIFPEVADPSAVTGLQGAINNLSNAWTDLAASPNSLSSKEAVVVAAQALAQNFNGAAQKLYSLQQNVDAQVNVAVTKINAYLDQVSLLNGQVFQARAAAQGAAPNVLLDARQEVMGKLAELINVQFNETTDGNILVAFNGGSLVDGAGSHHFTTLSSPTNPGTTAVGFPSKQGQVKDVTARITGGSLGALISFRDADLRQARLNLDEMAYGIIQRTNEINHTYTGVDGLGHAFFTGTKGSDIQVNSLLNASAAYVGGTRDAANPGDLAMIQAAQKDFVLANEICSAPLPTPGINIAAPINPALPMAGQVFRTAVLGAPNSITSPGQISIVSGGNAVTVKWGTDQSINTILANINAAGGGAFYAVFDPNDQRVMIFGTTPLQVYDSATSNLSDVFSLGAYMVSSAPINNSPIADLNRIIPNQNFITAANLLDYFSKVEKSGTGQVTVGGVSGNFNWTQLQNLFQVLNAVQTANPGLIAYFNPADQTINLYKDIASPKAANPVSAIGLGDKVGNFAAAANLESPVSLDNLFGGLVSSISAKSLTNELMSQQATNALTSLQDIQNTVAGVDPNTEIANINIYKNAFEASLRVQNVIDQMLNMLINNMATPSTSNTSSSSF